MDTEELLTAVSIGRGIDPKHIIGEADSPHMSLLQSFRTEPSLRRSAITVIMLITAVLIGDRLIAAASAGVVEGSSEFPVWLPQFGTIGRTFLYYTLLLEFLQFIALPVALMWLAYAYGQYTANHSAN